MHYCGGAIVAPNAILTAAHCFFSKKRGGFSYDVNTQIRLGAANHKSDILAETFDISSIIKHPLYNGRGPRNDLAIVFTADKIRFNDRKQKVALAQQIDSKEAKFSGWGFENDKNYATDVLRESDWGVYDEEWCPKFFNNTSIQNRLREGNIFCAATVVRYFVLP